MQRGSDKVLSLQIAGLQGFYWMIFCPISSYASVYLLSKNFSNEKIGWVMAISNVVAIVLQPVLGAILDRIKTISVKLVLIILALVCLVLLAGLIFLDAGLLWMAVFYVGIVALLLTMQPLVTTLTFEYINAGYNVSFGMTRAMGSICFAILSPLLGSWINRYSTEVIPIVCVALYTGFLLCIFTFPRVEKERHVQQEIEKIPGHVNAAANQGFLRRYERFIPFLIGVSCLFLFHTVINTYLAQIFASLGAKNTDFGISLTIAAVCELPAFLGFNYLTAKFHTQFLLRIASVFYAIRSIVFLLAASVWMVNLGQFLQGVSFAVFIPASVYYINKLMREDDKAKGQTFITGAITLGSVFGSVVGGWLLDKNGVTGMLAFAAAGAVIGCLLVIYSIRKPKKHSLMTIEDPAL